MPLYDDILTDLTNPKLGLSGPLLKMQVLASKLESDDFDSWVKHESSGYIEDTKVPDYRISPVIYTGTFNGPFGSGIKNAPIPPYIINELAGPDWVTTKIRSSISEVDYLFEESTKRGEPLVMSSSNDLILLLDGKVYDGYRCVEVKGTVSSSHLAAIQHAVRSKGLDLLLSLSKKFPDITKLSFSDDFEIQENEKKVVSMITNNTIYGDQVAISGHGNKVSVKIKKGNSNDVIQSLVQNGIPKKDAEGFVEVLASELPDENDCFGEKGAKWLVENLKKASKGTWGMGVGVATSLLTEAAKQYYGLD